ncbi:FAD-dependent oxidoreductase [Thermocoleostomius sinensis]|uniref:FAD-dependent oxidoreductase n=1 Tax=Thermocoleostomius sinensis TaxID=3065396 RepID=UPI0028F435E5|nr:FAD-dependent oxidoreductase [Thermocoleostomius sinensis]
MPLRLLRFGLSKSYPEPRMFTQPDRLKSSYDAVIIGGGGHGLAAAYYLSRDYGMTNLAVLERSYLGSGNTGRNTTIIRSNYLTPEGVKFYDESVRLWQDLSQDFDLNLFYSNRGHFTLAHTDAAVRMMRWRAEVNKHFGIDSELVSPTEVKKACPPLDITCGGRHPVLGALYHAPGSIARHDAVAWGYGRGANQRGVEIHQQTEVLGITIKSDRITGVETSRGTISTSRVLCAVAGFTPRLLQMVGLRSPLSIHPLQAMVSEPMKPWLDPIIVSGSLHVYVSQTARGELVMGASLDPYELHSTRSTLEFVEGLAAHMLELFPCLSHVKVVRQWAGMADMTPDFAPIMGKTPIAGFYLDAGWGTWGFKATPVCGKTMAYTIANDRNHDLIQNFTLDRFRQYELIGEKGAASVGH